MPIARPRRAIERLVLGLAGMAAGGFLFGQGRFFGGGQVYVAPDVSTAREVGTRSVGTPWWENAPGFEADVFTFARLRYDVAPRPANSHRGGWTTDLPDADLNLSYRLQQMTALKVDPNCRIVRATDPDLRQYPFLFAAAPGAMRLTELEVTALRGYLLNGGFMLMTDYWGEADDAYVERIFQQILPGLRFEELPIEHPLYHVIVNIREKAAVPNIRMGTKIPGTQVRHRAIFDRQGRLVVLGLHKSDDSEGWEREGGITSTSRSTRRRSTIPWRLILSAIS